jgi:signal transduction histidine kinase
MATGTISITHYYSVKVLSSTRAYTNFESQYAQGVKDASRHLISYIHSGEDVDYEYFKSDISIPDGGRMAREALEGGKNFEIARIGFSMGQNNKADLANMVWFFNKFRNEVFFKSAIQTWQKADDLVNQLNQVGTLAYNDTRLHKAFDKSDLTLKINTISDELTINQQQFSDVLGETSRAVDHQVFVFDIVSSVAILVLTALLAGIMLSKSQASQEVIIAQNERLKDMNDRINGFAHALTHDLRSPIASLVGLVSVLEREKDIAEIPAYTEMMRESLLLQDKYIQDVLAAIRSEKTGHAEVCNLKELVTDLERQNGFFAGGKKVHFVNELEVPELKCNVAGLKVVFNNLVSNAIKYADFGKPEQWIKIRSYREDQRCIIEVEDNGLGIPPEQKGNIFKMYFRLGVNKKSLGLGLYFVRQAIEEMQGTISVRSSLGAGTSFIVSLPL